VDTIIVTGITTEVCVLITVMDGLSHDFSVIILEDCSASRKKEFHQGCLSLYRDFALDPLLRIMTLDEFIKEVSSSNPSNPPLIKGGRGDYKVELV
jgi:isochorismate hydrolase